MEVTPDDLLEAAAVSNQALAPFVARDWSVQAGDLKWDARRTVAHARDALGWYAAHLAMQSPRRLRFDFRPHTDVSNAEVLDVLEAAAATLAAAARAAPPGAHAYHNLGMANTSGFLAMGWDESLVHGPLDEWDGAVPHQDANPPNRYEWDGDVRRSKPSW
jgi:hypothetical protein